jgi:hypothetical protein
MDKEPPSPTPSFASDNWDVISTTECINDVKEWLTDSCKIFARFPYEQIITNDSQYDIDSLYEAYEAKCKELDVKATHPFFNAVVKKSCKKERRRSRYADIEEEEDDYDYGYYGRDRRNYNQDIYQ